MNDSLRESVSHGTRDFPFACYIMEHLKPGFNVPLHWHDEIEILYIETGCLKLIINQTSYTGLPGNIFLVNPREIHGMTTEDRTMRYHALVFPLRFITFQTHNACANDFFLPLSQGLLLLHNRITEDTLHLATEQLIRRVLTLQKEKPAGYQLAIQLACAQLLYNLYADGAYKELAPLSGEPAVKREILACLQERYTENLSLKELAGIFHMSEKYFSRYFKKNFQMTLTDYLNSLRLENAARLLSDTTLSVTEVAFQSGFNNVSYFIRTFKAAFGCSPLRYRKS